MKYFLLPVFFMFGSFCMSQQHYSLDASTVNTEIESGHLKMGSAGFDGKALEVNNRYLTLKGEPIIPVMGEVHYSRVPRDQWEDVILKMKACGINIIAAYALWIHHEEIEGQFNWTGNNDLRAFAKLCAKHDLWFYPRIGPWCHAEVRNGGTPDWVLRKTNLKNRSNDPVYQMYAERWYAQVGAQLDGMMYKDGGPVIGVQLENEYRRGRGGENHILWLKRTAMKCGFDVPMYTVTGWGNASVPEFEVIPLFGAYPDAPWDSHLKRNKSCTDFSFTPFRDNQNIGNEAGQSKKPYVDLNEYPYLTCEMGVGIMNTYHRRLRIDSLDGLALVTVKVGSGSNLPGYYMFAGGSNPHGLLTSMEENKAETGYWNTNPVISYDFQGAIRESGELNASYHQVKKLHYFLNEFGSVLAPMEPVFPANEGNLQYVVRSNGNSAFLFGTNYCRHNSSVEQKGVQFEVKLKSETINFPDKPVTIADSSVFIWPLNFEIGSVRLNYATAQPLCHLGNRWVFIENAVNQPEFCFDALTVKKVESSSGTIYQKQSKIWVKNIEPSKESVLRITANDGTEQVLVVLSKEEAKNAWLFNEDDIKQFYISEAGLYIKEGQLNVFSISNQFEVFRLTTEDKKEGLFIAKSMTIPEKTVDFQFEKLFPLDGAEWLKTSAVDRLDNKHQLYHRFFTKEFSLSNPSVIKRVQLLIYPQSDGSLQVNNKWVNNPISVGELNTIDVTGYVQKGENRLMLEFPFQEGDNRVAAKLVVEFFNTDRVEFVSDQSWLMKDAYNYPSYLTGYGGFKAPEIVAAPDVELQTNKLVYQLNLANDYLDNLNNLYVKINYSGNKGRLYFNHQLIADDFYSGAIWSTGLNRVAQNLAGGNLQLEIEPLPENARVYFDDIEAGNKANKPYLEKIQLVPEYCVVFD